VIFSFWGCLEVPAHAQEAVAQIRAEIERFQRALKDKPITDSDFTPIATVAGDALRAATESAKASRWYLRLEQLGTERIFTGELKLMLRKRKW
jgi:hypothetical protein